MKVDPMFKNLKDDKLYWDLYERTGHNAYDNSIPIIRINNPKSNNNT